MHGFPIYSDDCTIWNLRTAGYPWVKTLLKGAGD
jgi:hypothetical protein